VTTFQFRAYTEAISFHSDAELLESVLPSHPLCLTAKLPWDSVSPAEAQFSIDFFALGSVLGLAEMFFIQIEQNVGNAILPHKIPLCEVPFSPVLASPLQETLLCLEVPGVVCAVFPYRAPIASINFALICCGCDLCPRVEARLIYI